MKYNLTTSFNLFHFIGLIFLYTTTNLLQGDGTISNQTELYNALKTGTGTWTLQANIVLNQALPVRSGDITFNGNGHTIDGNNAYQIFFVQSGTVTLQNISLANGLSKGGLGGLSN
ncbi:MAG: hypothetical protein EB053_04940, partial [Chlamydiae bacterium]|nr:hypothetical protein [Chlamydiota bacterium]